MNKPKIISPSRTERKKEKTKLKILTVTMSLFKEHGIGATTMEQIAEEADIAKGTLYNYFPAKEAIITEYIHRSFAENRLRRIAQLHKLPDTRSRIMLVLSELMEGIRAQPVIFEKYLTYQVQNMLSIRRDSGIKSGFDHLGAEIVMLGQESGELRKDIPQEILTSLFGFAFIEVAQQFYTDPDNFNAREVIEQCSDLFMNGAKGEKTDSRKGSNVKHSR